MHHRPHRFASDYPCVIKTPSGPVKSKILNLNETGARLATQRALSSGDRIGFTLVNTRVPAHVVWASGGGCGVVFKTQLTPAQVDMLRHSRALQPAFGAL